MVLDRSHRDINDIAYLLATAVDSEFAVGPAFTEAVAICQPLVDSASTKVTATALEVLMAVSTTWPMMLVKTRRRRFNGSLGLFWQAKPLSGPLINMSANNNQ